MRAKRKTKTGFVVLAGSAVVAGCGLGYIDLPPEPSPLILRIENSATDLVEVTVTSSPIGGAPTEEGGEEGGESPGAIGHAATVRVESIRSSSGVLLCDEQLLLTAVVLGTVPQTVTLTGAGTGSLGFDSGSVGQNGERLLLAGMDFTCDDTIVVRVGADGTGDVVVVPPDGVLPDPLTPVDDEPEDDGGGDRNVVFRLENATASTADVTVTPQAPDGGDPVEPARTVRVPAGEFTAGVMTCGSTFVVAAAIAQDDEGGGESVSFSGDGTGTIGFDGGSVGPSGERFLVFNEHYGCGETIVARIADDGSGVGLSTSPTPLGTINVFSDGQTPPEPDLPDPDQGGDDPDEPQGQTGIIIDNQTESFVQLRFSTGGSESDLAFEVRVPAQTSTAGTTACAQEFIIAADHLERPDSVDGQGFHTVILLGDGSGADGFDENNVGIDNTRTLKLGTHFECGDTIRVAITATNNTIDPLTLLMVYGVGEGTVAVSSGP